MKFCVYLTLLKSCSIYQVEKIGPTFHQVLGWASANSNCYCTIGNFGMSELINQVIESINHKAEVMQT